MLIKKATKKAFTLVELSVVIVIISIMLSTVIVSRSLIASAKINKIQEEYRMFNQNIQVFETGHNCLAGDCTVAQLGSISSVLPPLCGTQSNNPAVVGSFYDAVNTGSIESSLKRTCMMLELQADNYLSGLNMAINATAATLAGSVANANIPYAKFSRQAAWDYRLVTPILVSTAANSITIPMANGIGSLLSWAGSHQLTLRDSSVPTTAASTSTSVLPVGDITSTSTSSGATYPISSLLAQKLDLKFDDGLPYSGTISGGRNLTDSGSSFTTVSTAPCTSLIATGGEANGTNITSSVTYNNSNNLNFGCIVSYLM